MAKAAESLPLRLSSADGVCSALGQTYSVRHRNLTNALALAAKFAILIDATMPTAAFSVTFWALVHLLARHITAYGGLELVRRCFRIIELHRRVQSVFSRYGLERDYRANCYCLTAWPWLYN